MQFSFRIHQDKTKWLDMRHSNLALSRSFAWLAPARQVMVIGLMRNRGYPRQIIEDALLIAGLEPNPGPKVSRRVFDRLVETVYSGDARWLERLPGDREGWGFIRRAVRSVRSRLRDRHVSRAEIASRLIAAGVEPNPGPPKKDTCATGKAVAAVHSAAPAAPVVQRPKSGSPAASAAGKSGKRTNPGRWAKQAKAARIREDKEKRVAEKLVASGASPAQAALVARDALDCVPDRSALSDPGAAPAAAPVSSSSSSASRLVIADLGAGDEPEPEPAAPPASASSAAGSPVVPATPAPSPAGTENLAHTELLSSAGAPAASAAGSPSSGTVHVVETPAPTATPTPAASAAGEGVAERLAPLDAIRATVSEGFAGRGAASLLAALRTVGSLVGISALARVARRYILNQGHGLDRSPPAPVPTKTVRGRDGELHEVPLPAALLGHLASQQTAERVTAQFGVYGEVTQRVACLEPAQQDDRTLVDRGVERVTAQLELVEIVVSNPLRRWEHALQRLAQIVSASMPASLSSALWAARKLHGALGNKAFLIPAAVGAIGAAAVGFCALTRAVSGRRRPESFVYAPHQLTAVLRETSPLASVEVVAANARQKLLRTAALPLPDALALHVTDVTEAVAVVEHSERHSGFHHRPSGLRGRWAVL